MSELNLRHIAKLARLHFEDRDLAVFESQVKNILQFVEELKQVNTDGVEPTSHPLKLQNVFREDQAASSVDIEIFLKHAPAAHRRFFEVPKVIEEK